MIQKPKSFVSTWDKPNILYTLKRAYNNTDLGY